MQNMIVKLTQSIYMIKSYNNVFVYDSKNLFNQFEKLCQNYNNINCLRIAILKYNLFVNGIENIYRIILPL